MKNNLDMDRALACYLVTGDELFILLNILEGQTIHIPSKKRLATMNLHNINLIEDDELNYKDYVKGNIITFKDKEYEVVAKERRILNHYYIPVIELKEDLNGKTDE